MSIKHLGPDSTMPPLQKGKIRLYSCVFCPYCERARLVLAAKNIDYEIVNIKLRDEMPDWFIKLNPAKSVPVLQHDDGRMLTESLIIAEYIDELFPEKNKLKPNIPYVQAMNRVAFESFNKIPPLFYKLASEKNIDKPLNEAISEFLSHLRSGENFLGGLDPSFTDYMVWPWFERLEFARKFNKFVLDESIRPKYEAYVNRMMELPAVKKCFISAEKHHKYAEARAANPSRPDYDSGL